MAASGKILNTNMGLGFQRGRKYDTDLDRLGRMETAQSELRKTGELNMQKELKKLRKNMATYSIKRFSQISQKEYGMSEVAGAVGNGVRDVAGTAIETGGKLLDNGVTKTAAGIAGLGAMGTGASVGASIGSVLGPLGCVCKGTRVLTNEGKFINIEDIKQEDGIIGWDGNKASQQVIYILTDPAEKECVEITFDNGEVLKCSVDHPILATSKGRAERKYVNGIRTRVKNYEFKRADSLIPGDKVGVINEIPIWGKEEMQNPYLVGLLIGDGTYGYDKTTRLFSGDKNTWDYIENNNLGVRLFSDAPEGKYQKEFRSYRIIDGNKLMRFLGIYGQTKQEKRLPEDIHKYTKESICQLIAGLIDTDGSVTFYGNDNPSNVGSILFSQSNLELIKQVREQLLKLGIHSSLFKHGKQTSALKNGHFINSKPGYVLKIKDKVSIINFYNNIHLNIDYKQEALENLYRQKLSGLSTDRRELTGVKSVKVKEIKFIGKENVYNLQADDSHTYIANGIVTHNSLAGGAIGALATPFLAAKGTEVVGKGLKSIGQDIHT